MTPGEEGAQKSRGSALGQSALPPARGQKLSGRADAPLTVTVGASGEGAGRGRRPEMQKGLRLGKLTSILGGTCLLVGGCSDGKRTELPVYRWWGGGGGQGYRI